MNSAALLRFAQLTSPSLPIGGYAYSDGLETAVERGWVDGEDATHAWIAGRLDAVLALVDLPLVARMMAAVRAGDELALRRWSRLLRAMRDSGEARRADRDRGQALARLLVELGIAGARAWRDDEDATVATGFALAAEAWGLDEATALAGHAWSWADGQVAAAIKLVPLGQTAGQRVLSALGAAIPAAVIRAQGLRDDELGGAAPAAAMACAWHEAQRVRLFRS